MHTYEIEIKSLLGSKENADSLRVKLRESMPDLKEGKKHSQLNHYFNEPQDTEALKEAILPHISKEKHEKLAKILTEGSSFSVRTRDADGTVLFVIKASIGNDTSSNGVSRIEFEEKVDMTLSELDRVLLDTGLTYQAKWSREREEYSSSGMNITIDKNAGYGYLAEFEKVVDSDRNIEGVKKELLDTMASLGAPELAQDRLERMFAFYNKNWEDYYGTDKIFTIE